MVVFKYCCGICGVFVVDYGIDEVNNDNGEENDGI